MDFYRHQSALTLIQAVEGVQIANLHPEAVQEALINLLKALESSLNIKEKLKLHQVLEIATEVAREYKSLSLEEIILCFRNGKLGYYGKDYNRMDIITISTWLREYKNSAERKTAQSAIEDRKNVEGRLSWAKEATAPSPDVEKKIQEQISGIGNKKRKVSEWSATAYYQNLKKKTSSMTIEELLVRRQYAANDLTALEVIDQEIKKRK